MVYSLARANTDSEFAWRQCVVELPAASGLGDVLLRSLGNWRLMFSDNKDFGEMQYLHMLTVDTSRASTQHTRIKLPLQQKASGDFSNRSFNKYLRIYGFDVKLAGSDEIWLALARETNKAGRKRELAIFRVVGDSAEPELLSLPHTLPNVQKSPLFCGDTLLALVYEGNGPGNRWEVHELGIGSRRIEPRRVILCGCDPIETNEWCVANGALVAWNLVPNHLAIFYSVL